MACAGFHLKISRSLPTAQGFPPAPEEAPKGFLLWSLSKQGHANLTELLLESLFQDGATKHDQDMGTGEHHPSLAPTLLSVL